MKKNNYKNLFNMFKYSIVLNQEAQFINCLQEISGTNTAEEILNIVDDNGMSLLQYAVANGRSSMAKLLLQHGANKDKCSGLFDTLALLKYDLFKSNPSQAAYGF